MKNVPFFFGNWLINPASNSLESAAGRHQMEPRAMDVLVTLCSSAGLVVSSEQLQVECWGSTLHGDNPVHKAITQLRRLLGDSASAPIYIETIRKRGYRAIAPIRREQPSADAAPNAWHAASPFCGLDAFDATHAAVFFGRDDAVAALLRALAQQVQAQRALLLVLGASGSGKTSLIRAGLLPALERQARAIGAARLSSASLDLGDLSEGQLFAGLAGAMLDWQVAGDSVFAGASAFSLGQRIEHSIAEVIGELGAATQANQTGLVLFLDRFEAIFTLSHITQQQRQQWIAVIDALACSGYVRLIVACRNDFYSDLAAYPALMTSKAGGGHFDLSPPTPADIAQIIRRPAQAAQLTFGVDPQTQARLDDTLCLSAATSPDALPLLQYTLQELYRLRSPEGELGVAALHQLGGLEGAIGSRAEQVVAALDEQHRHALPRVLSLIVTFTDDAAASRRAPYSALNCAAERELVNALVEARLFVSAFTGVEAGFGVAHEALLRRWDRASAWITLHRSSLRIRARVSQLSQRWAAAGQPDDLLLPEGQDLEQAGALMFITALSLAPEEVALINASQRKARRQRQLRLGAMVLILTLAVLAVIFGITALKARGVAQERRIQAESLMGFMLGDFADKLRPLGRLDLLDSVSSKALTYLAGSSAEQLSATSLTHRAKALAVIGEVRITRGDPQGANAALLAGNAILRQKLVATPYSADVLKQLGANTFWLGQIRVDQNDWASAQQFFIQYLESANRLSALDPSNIDAWIEQSYAHNSLGSLAIKRGDSSTAETEFSTSIELKTKALARQPHNTELITNLADSLSWAAVNHEARGELDAAHSLYLRTASLNDELHQAAPRDLLWALNLSTALHHEAALSQVRGMDQPAHAAYTKASSLLKQLVNAEPAHREAQRSLLIAQLELLNIEARGEPSALAPLLMLSKKISDMAKLDPSNVEWTNLDALALQRLAATWFQLGHSSEAQSSIDAALLRLNRIYAANPGNKHTRSRLASALLTKAEIGRDNLGCQSVVTLLGPAAAASTDFRLLDPWVRAQRCLGNTAPAAEAWLQKIGYREDAYLKYLSHHVRKLP